MCSMCNCLVHDLDYLCELLSTSPVSARAMSPGRNLDLLRRFPTLKDLPIWRLSAGPHSLRCGLNLHRAKLDLNVPNCEGIKYEKMKQQTQTWQIIHCHATLQRSANGSNSLIFAKDKTTTKLSAVSVSERIERMVPVWSPPLAFMALTPLMALISRLPWRLHICHTMSYISCQTLPSNPIISSSYLRHIFVMRYELVFWLWLWPL